MRSSLNCALRLRHASGSRRIFDVSFNTRSFSILVASPLSTRQFKHTLVHTSAIPPVLTVVAVPAQHLKTRRETLSLQPTIEGLSAAQRPNLGGAAAVYVVNAEELALVLPAAGALSSIMREHPLPSGGSSL